MHKRKPTRRTAILFLVMLWLLSSVAAAQTYVGDMSAEINSILPTTDPYCTENDDEIYENLNTSKVDTSEFEMDTHLCTRVTLADGSMPAEVVDWILVELRAVARVGSDAAPATAVGFGDGSTVIARKPAFLLTNGRIVDAVAYAALDTANQTPQPCTGLTESSNCPDVVFDEGDVATAADGKDLYLVLRHRNHIDIMSSAPLTDSDSSGVYRHDFTAAVSNTYENNIKSNARGLGKIAMFSGDANSDGNINSSDYTREIGPFIGNDGYVRSDTDLNGNINSSDYTISVSPNIGRGDLNP